MGPPVSRAPPFPPCVHGPLVLWGSAAEPGCQDEPCQPPAWWPQLSHRGSGTGDFPRWHFRSRKVGTRRRSGGERALVSSWGSLLRDGGCRPQGTGAFTAGRSCSVLSSPPLRCKPSHAWGHQLQPPWGKGSESTHRARLFALSPQRREEKAAPLGVSGSRGFLQRRKTPSPRPPRPSWPLQRSAPAGSCF